MTIPLSRHIVVGASALLALSLGACTTPAQKSAQPPTLPTVKIVATTTQICDYVTQIAQDTSQNSTLILHKTDASGRAHDIGAPAERATAALTLTCLLAPNASAHEHEMTPQQTEAMREADLLLVNGVDLEHFLDQVIESSGFHGTLGVTSGIRSAADVDDLNAQIAAEKSLPYTIDRGSQHVTVKPWPFPPEEGESTPEFRFDPHVWTSPANAAIQVANIGEFLEKASPEHRELFESRVSAYATALRDLNAWAQASLETVPVNHRVLFTSHDAFGYFSATYGVTFIGAALSDFNEQQDATAEHIRQAVETVKASGALALFAENSNNSRSIETIAHEAGVRAIIGDDALYGDSLGPENSPGATYIGSIIHNVTVITQAWNGRVAELPSTLAGTH